MLLDLAAALRIFMNEGHVPVGQFAGVIRSFMAKATPEELEYLSEASEAFDAYFETNPSSIGQYNSTLHEIIERHGI